MVFDEDRYEIAMRGPDRVAGRTAEVFTVRPKDGYRYGYRLWVDRETAMLLKSQLTNEEDRLVEEFRFTEIGFPDLIADADVQPSTDIESFTWTRPEPAVNRKVSIDDADWRAMDLPPGFELAAVRSRSASAGNGQLKQLVYSDGLASVSVFIEMDIDESEFSEGLSRIGGARAYTTTREGCLITAVGDVPEKTARMIALSVRPVGEAR
jgi:sigma-E factor negative regulatory protein RseB